MGRYSVKRYKTKRRTKDLDLIYDDLSSQDKIQKLLNQPLDETKAGLGQHYCIHCAKYCETAMALKTHLKTKVHKRRVKELKGVPYTQEVANAAAGVNLNKFLNRVEQIKNSVGPSKDNNEVLLKDHLDVTLKDIKSTEPALPWADGQQETNENNAENNQTPQVENATNGTFMG
ncbi:similar to Saccharomyces cerevisiae YLR074C BUD20 Protein involved in bud-site selection [Maudiozyma barnettii]|uniref:Similar to Saccharomyces cerevisiae YLR074C BUD20 Protein involved in bud-site selection n=1 Tax=Maudiozyma barnettii TaxID=61262 RepID=A0A8H2VEL6_9SACH|nr:Bud20p [Kazachstania barnettii]CAB4254150.1 similar to Saccharomyces cerevisiae YLR074C BUD20 Protein involved in bud-site selection [Kazachstania barnettii]CAD1781900.1 similar to Saccharomyces cerevisiae YLR074C BUD20 Protein involved in bud-site selection [Kazachstania barnettii]